MSISRRRRACVRKQGTWAQPDTASWVPPSDSPQNSCPQLEQRLHLEYAQFHSLLQDRDPIPLWQWKLAECLQSQKRRRRHTRTWKKWFYSRCVSLRQCPSGQLSGTCFGQEEKQRQSWTESPQWTADKRRARSDDRKQQEAFSVLSGSS